MNFDPSGVLNAILSAVSLPSGSIQPNMADGVEENFSDFLERMRAVVGQPPTGGLPLESGEWNLRPPPQVSAENLPEFVETLMPATAGPLPGPDEWRLRLQPEALAENLRTLQRYLETLTASGGEGGKQARRVVEGVKSGDTEVLDDLLTEVSAAFLQSIQAEPAASRSMAQTEDAPRSGQATVDVIHALIGLAAELEREGEAGPAPAESFLSLTRGEMGKAFDVQDAGEGSPALASSWQRLDVGPGSFTGLPAGEEAKAGSTQGGFSPAAVMTREPLETAPPAGESVQFPEAWPETSESEAAAVLSRGEPAGADDSSSRSLQVEVPDAPTSLREGRPMETAPPAGSEKSSQRPLLDLTRPFDHPQWPDELGQRLLWMHGKTMQVAELRVNPQHLGPIEVRIEMRDDQTTIQFTSHHAVVREAIESALPRLRELFGLQQLQLAQVDVSGQSLSDQPHSSPRRDSAEGGYGNGGAADRAEEGETLETGARRSPVSGNRLLNLYA